MAVKIYVTTRGPLLTGKAPGIMRAFVHEVTEDVSQLGVNMVHQRLGTVLKNPTGHYSSQVVTDRASPDRVDITDHGVIYGPWLEGTGGRNHKSRFKGYRTFRKTKAALSRRTRPIAEQILGRYLARLNG